MDDLSITPISSTACTSYLNAAARRLCCGNMLATYKRHGMNWVDEQFTERWQDNENFAIRVNGEWVGFLSLKALPDMLYLRDLQLMPQWQRRGVGSACLEWLIQKASQESSTTKEDSNDIGAVEKHASVLRLRVFSDSPALALYERHGFTRVNEQETPTRGGSILAMEKQLGTLSLTNHCDSAEDVTDHSLTVHPSKLNYEEIEAAERKPCSLVMQKGARSRPPIS